MGKRQRATLRVLVCAEKPKARIPMVDERGWVLKWREMTSRGLWIGNKGLLIPGPITVPDVSYYRALIGHGDLVVVPGE